jgi:hypothetical protein
LRVVGPGRFRPKSKACDAPRLAERLSIHGWLVDRVHYRVSVRMSDGSLGPMLKLPPLFEQFFAEAV